MRCSSIGIIGFVVSVVLLVPMSFAVVLFVLAPRRFQGWLRTHRVTSRFARAFQDSFFADSGSWAIRATGIVLALMWIVTAGAVYCFLRGPG